MEEANILLAKPSTEPSRKTEPLQAEVALTLTSANFEHIAPEVMQDFLCEKIEWLRTKAKGGVKATVDEIYAIDQLHEKELVEFLLFAESKAKERIACNA